MNNHFVFVDDLSDIRQGDIIRQCSETTPQRQVWGVIITADCDIAQRKAGNRYTWLEIITLEDYLELDWAPGQLRKLIEKQANSSSEELNGLIKSIAPNLAPLSPNSLCTWLSDTTPEEILNNINSKNKKIDQKLISSLKAIRIALDYQDNTSELDRLRKAWETLGLNENRQKTNIRSALNGGGFPDYVVIPELPDTEEYGFVIRLRSFFSLDSNELFNSRADAKINNKPNAFYRIGRFSDWLRFFIVQKVAFLFSRIGMTEEFEGDCEEMADIAIDAIYKKSENEKSI
ncbi:hypothetical protein ACQE3D_11995 [Methylomonas sp. MS20]|uniref:hypothetical protein n=1 Tax=unclassified Methylomonas TaxID=2608980 RepID=UPI0028A471EC|nr:hypothetical protein [Methylomonas sp. MV1]MDT4328280.1 hypothetical protein [Methylomonas sp. MV1]